MHSHVQFVVAAVHVYAKSILKGTCDVRACGLFLGMQCGIALFGRKWPENVLEHSILF